jgi:hypothetical protein
MKSAPINITEKTQPKVEPIQSKAHTATMALAGIVLLAVLAVSIYFFQGGNRQAKANSYFPQGYQAVFLDNEQVYFGKITNISDKIVVLENIFYLQNNSSKTTGDNQSDIKLIKLGNELHGPEDSMQINRDHILFTETLRGDSKVVKAIQEYVVK